jgi:hypothetical protein
MHVLSQPMTLGANASTTTGTGTAPQNQTEPAAAPSQSTSTTPTQPAQPVISQPQQTMQTHTQANTFEQQNQTPFYTQQAVTNDNAPTSARNNNNNTGCLFQSSQRCNISSGLSSTSSFGTNSIRSNKPPIIYGCGNTDQVTVCYNPQGI